MRAVRADRPFVRQPIDQLPADARRRRIHEIVFEADTPAGWAFDVALTVLIVASILVVMLESVPSVRQEHATLLRGLEWGFTILFTVEYAVRLYSVRRPLRPKRSLCAATSCLPCRLPGGKAAAPCLPPGS